MLGPLAGLQEKLDELEAKVLLAARICVLKELTICQLSRLATLDTVKAATYLSAIETIG